MEDCWPILICGAVLEHHRSETDDRSLSVPERTALALILNRDKSILDWASAGSGQWRRMQRLMSSPENEHRDRRIANGLAGSFRSALADTLLESMRTHSKGSKSQVKMQCFLLSEIHNAIHHSWYYHRHQSSQIMVHRIVT